MFGQVKDEKSSADSATHITLKVKDQVKDEKSSDSGTHITLKVKDQDEKVVHFRIRKDTKLKSLMENYCARQQVDSLVFLFDSLRLKGDHTPTELEMEDGDEIDVFGHQIGGSPIQVQGRKLQIDMN